jgi:predicted dehydrogenase
VPFSSAGLGRAEPVPDIRGVVLGHRGGIADLIACVRESKTPLCDATAGRETIEMIQAIFASFAAGTRVTVPWRDRSWPLR